jgi:hypothetical protein
VVAGPSSLKEFGLHIVAKLHLLFSTVGPIFSSTLGIRAPGSHARLEGTSTHNQKVFAFSASLANRSDTI